MRSSDMRFLNGTCVLSSAVQITRVTFHTNLILKTDMDPVIAIEDFKKRVLNYEKVYEPIGEWEEEVENVQYCKVRSLHFNSRVATECLDDQRWQESRLSQHSRFPSWSSNFLPLKF